MYVRKNEGVEVRQESDGRKGDRREKGSKKVEKTKKGAKKIKRG